MSARKVFRLVLINKELTVANILSGETMVKMADSSIKIGNILLETLQMVLEPTRKENVRAMSYKDMVRITSKACGL